MAILQKTGPVVPENDRRFDIEEETWLWGC